jgi:hypothetical protein
MAFKSKNIDEMMCFAAYVDDNTFKTDRAVALQRLRRKERPNQSQLDSTC